MAIQKIQYTNKEQLVNDTTINDKYKCKADDLNEIKSVVNNNADEIPSNDNLVNVGSSVDTDYKTNILYSKNLCDGINQNAWLNTASNSAGMAPDNSGLYIAVNGGNYTISTSTSQARYRVACFDNLPLTSSGQTAYNGVNKDETSDTITIDTTGHNYLIVNATDLTKIFIAKGDTATTEPYITPSINIDGEEIYSKPVVLWTNPSSTSDFAQQRISLNEDASNYKFLEIYWKNRKDINEWTYTKMFVGTIGYGFMISASGTSFRAFARQAGNTTTNEINFSSCNYVESLTSSLATANNYMIPYQVIGYK